MMAKVIVRKGQRGKLNVTVHTVNRTEQFELTPWALHRFVEYVLFLKKTTASDTEIKNHFRE